MHVHGHLSSGTCLGPTPKAKRVAGVVAVADADADADDVPTLKQLRLSKIQR